MSVHEESTKDHTASMSKEAQGPYSQAEGWEGQATRKEGQSDSEKPSPSPQLGGRSFEGNGCELRFQCSVKLDFM